MPSLSFDREGYSLFLGQNTTDRHGDALFLYQYDVTVGRILPYMGYDHHKYQNMSNIARNEIDYAGYKR